MKTLVFALGALALVGCSGIRPVGILSKDTPIIQQGQPLPNEPPAAPPPLQPTPPTMLITSEQVDPNNPYAAAGKLSLEVEADSKALTNLAVTAEISRYKDGVKQP